MNNDEKKERTDVIEAEKNKVRDFFSHHPNLKSERVSSVLTLEELAFGVLNHLYMYLGVTKSVADVEKFISFIRERGEQHNRYFLEKAEKQEPIFICNQLNYNYAINYDYPADRLFFIVVRTAFDIKNVLEGGEKERETH